MKDSKMHTGHRQRLKDRARKNGLEDFNTYEALELALTYPIMFKDTNEISHRLLDSYGSFANIVDAPREDLVKNKGVGEEAALFLNLIKDFAKLYESSKQIEFIPLNSVANCIKFFRDKIGVSKFEESYLIFTDKNDRFVKITRMSEGDEFKTSFTREKLRYAIASVKATNIILIHTHPFGAVTPSSEDFFVTKVLAGVCKILGVDLRDHIIINKKDAFSFRNNNILMEIKIDAENRLDDTVPSHPRNNPFEQILNKNKFKK